MTIAANSAAKEKPLNRFEGSHEEQCQELRKEYQARVGDLCMTEPHCLSTEEIRSLLTRIPARLILQGFASVHSQLLKLKAQCVFVDMEHVVQMTHNAISKAVADDTRFREHSAAKQEHDFSMTYESERLAKRRDKIEAERAA